MTRIPAPRGRMLRPDDAAAAVTPIELFFDLVYVYAITKLSTFVLQHLTVNGALQTAVLLAMVWQVWIYTTWCTNYIDLRRQETRFMLLALMFGSLLFASALGGAFGGAHGGGDRGMFVAVCYLTMQVGRCLFLIWALRGEALQATFRRILVWSSLTSVLMIVGATVSTEHAYVREALWAASIAIDLIGGAFGFWVPGLDRSDTRDWTVTGGHFAERCQAFILIALGESVAQSGVQASSLHFDATGWSSVIVVFATSAGLWWLYFDRAAEDSANVIAGSDDPGRLARNAFHWIHPIMVGGIILNAAADEVILRARGHDVAPRFAWLILGGGALFLLGHALFKRVVWRTLPIIRLAGCVALLAAGVLAGHASALALGIFVLVVITAIAIGDRYLLPAPNGNAPTELRAELDG